MTGFLVKYRAPLAYTVLLIFVTPDLYHLPSTAAAWTIGAAGAVIILCAVLAENRNGVRWAAYILLGSIALGSSILVYRGMYVVFTVPLSQTTNWEYYQATLGFIGCLSLLICTWGFMKIYFPKKEPDKPVEENMERESF